MGDETRFPTTTVKGSSVVIISLYLGPSKGPGSSFTHFHFVTSSNNGIKLPLKVPRRTHNLDELSGREL